MSSAAPRATPVRVEITTNSDRTYVAGATPDELIGSSKNAVSFEFIALKFKNCCAYSVKPISEQNQKAVISMIENMENVDDVGQIGSLIAP